MKRIDKANIFLKLLITWLLPDVALLSAILVALDLAMVRFHLNDEQIFLLFTYPMMDVADRPSPIFLIINIVILFLPGYLTSQAFNHLEEGKASSLTCRIETVFFRYLFTHGMLLIKIISILIPYSVCLRLLLHRDAAGRISYFLSFGFCLFFMALTTQFVRRNQAIHGMLASALIFIFSYLLLMIKLDFANAFSPLYFLYRTGFHIRNSVGVLVQISLFLVVGILDYQFQKCRDYLRR